MILSVQMVSAQVATITAPEYVLISEQFEFTVTFENTSSDTGYGPFIDLWIPYDGADGAATSPGADGIIFDTAWFLEVGTGGVEVPAHEYTFPASGCFDHPYLRDTELNPIPVCGSPGDRLVILDIPLGAMTPDFPVVEIIVQATVSEYADVDVPLTIGARGGFRFGTNPVDDPCCDAYILSSRVSTPVIPVVYTMIKQGVDGMTETATGPNFEQGWEIIIDIADGQEVDELTVTDYLPDNVIVTGVSTTPVIAGTTTTPATFPFGPVSSSGNELLINFPSGSPITGTTADDDLVITVEFYGALNDADGDLVLGPNDPSVEDDAPALNEFMGEGDWPPNDSRDGAYADNATFNGLCPTVCPGGNAPTLLGIAVQKTIIRVITDNPPTGRSPGDILEYQLDFQVSDYYTYADIEITDVLSDGLAFISSFTPTFDVSNRGSNYAGNFDPADYTVASDTPAAGQTTLHFLVSDQLAAAGLAGGIMQGGRAQSPDTTGAEGSITYRVEILEDYTASVSPNTSAVDQWDTLSNEAVISGSVQDNASPTTPTGDSETDDAYNEFEIVNGAPSKEIYAFNGTICSPCTGVVVEAGDIITYRISQDLPASDFDVFSLTERLPLPVFDVGGFSTTFNTTIDATVPAVDTAKFGPNETLYGLSGIAPTLTTDSVENAVIFDWGGYDGGNNTTSIIDVLFTVEVTSAPFADELVLANLVETDETTTQNVVYNQYATVAIEATSPLLLMTKGAVSSDGSVVYSPTTTGPVTFNSPGSTPAFTGTINSTNLDAAPIDSDLSGIQVGDLVTFAIAIENTGSNANGAFDIQVRDTIPTGFAIPAGGPNLQVTRGNGLTVGYTPLGGGGASDLFGAGIEINDSGIGACSPYSGTSGINILIITYDLQLTREPNGTVANLGEIINYSSVENGFDHTGVQDLSNEARALFASRSGGSSSSSSSSGSSSSQVTTQGGNLVITKEVDLAVAQPGDSLTWTIRVSNPGSTAVTNITVTDVVSDQVTVNDLSTSMGSAQINGRTITWTLDQLSPGQEATLTVRSRIHEDATSPGILVNTALILISDSQVGEVQAQTLIGVQTLPKTGESPMCPTG